MITSQQQNYRLAVNKGFEGSFEDWKNHTKLSHKIWGRSRLREKGIYTLHEKCIVCGKKKSPHYSNGMCISCYEKKRNVYKAMKAREYYANSRRNKLQTKASQIWN